MKKLIPASALALIVPLLGLSAAPASAAISPAENAAFVVDCGVYSTGDSALSGVIGDTFTIQNTSTTTACPILVNQPPWPNPVTANGGATEIAPSSTVTFTIVGPDGVLGINQNGAVWRITITVVEPAPEPDPEPDVEAGASADSLPNTGGPDGSVMAISALAGIALVGAGIVTVTRRRRHTS